jgi:hypothetical protein
VNATAAAGKAWEEVHATFNDATRLDSGVSCSYRSIVREHQRRRPHQVRLKNTGGWRFNHCSRAPTRRAAGIRELITLLRR